MTSSPSCPICKKPALTRSLNPAFPFCSPRCRSVDLGKWLGEEYRVPQGGVEEEEDGLPRIPGDGTGDEG